MPVVWCIFVADGICLFYEVCWSHEQVQGPYGVATIHAVQRVIQANPAHLVSWSTQVLLCTCIQTITLVTKPYIRLVQTYCITVAEVISWINLYMIDINRVTLSGIIDCIIEGQNCIGSKLRQLDSVTHEYIYLTVAILVIELTSTRWQHHKTQLIDTITTTRSNQRIMIYTSLGQQLTTEVIFLAATNSILSNETIILIYLQVLNIDRIEAIYCLQRVIIYTRCSQYCIIKLEGLVLANSVV